MLHVSRINSWSSLTWLICDPIDTNTCRCAILHWCAPPEKQVWGDALGRHLAAGVKLSNTFQDILFVSAILKVKNCLMVVDLSHNYFRVSFITWFIDIDIHCILAKKRVQFRMQIFTKQMIIHNIVTQFTNTTTRMQQKSVMIEAAAVIRQTHNRVLQPITLRVCWTPNSREDSRRKLQAKSCLIITHEQNQQQPQTKQIKNKTPLPARKCVNNIIYICHRCASLLHFDRKILTSQRWQSTLNLR